jgi:AmmeMemoRadiSam system protein A
LLHRLASLGIDYAVLGPSKERISLIQRAIESVPQHLRGDGGAFVTLWRGGQLRGCMGYMEPSQPLYRAVLENGANAAAGDRRFPPVQPAELDHLEVEISVLSPPTAISSDEEFRVGEHGVILRKGDRRGLYLPEVAKREGWTREETLSRLARKAGLTAGAWREGAILEVFSSTKYGAPYQAYSVLESGPARIGEDAAMPASGRRAAAVE